MNAQHLYWRWAGWRFRPHRADFYDYLGTVMTQTDGRKSLLDILADDAARQGPRALRGRLSAHWAEQYRKQGGDLGSTFAGTLPRDDVSLIRVAQLAGSGALAAGLGDLASTARLLDQAYRGLLTTLVSAVVAVVVMLLVLALVPLLTVPSLQQTFQMVPADYWGPHTRRLFGLATLLQQYWPALLVATGPLALAVVASLARLTGTFRRWLDRRWLWRLYRDFHSIRFMALLAGLLRPQGGAGLSLRDALLAQWSGANRWLRWHLQAMVERVDDGWAGADTFDTGLLDRDLLGFLGDMIEVHGIDEGVARTGARIERQWLGALLRRAHRLRWLLLGVAVATVLAVMFWHYAVIDELRRGMQAVFATG